MDSGPGEHDHVLLDDTSQYVASISGLPVKIHRLDYVSGKTSNKLIAGVVRDTLYIDGGYLWWEPGMSDGTYGGQISDGMEIFD